MARELIGAEEHIPYERPPLSKGYLAGQPYSSHDLLPSGRWYADHDVTLRLGQRAVELDRDRQEVIVGDGTRIRYDQVLLATGVRPRRLDAPGHQLPEVHYLRTLEDSERLGSRLLQGRNIVMIGGGWTGLEVAAVAAGKGCRVTVVDPHQVALESALGREVGQFFVDVHRASGVDFVFERYVTAIRGTSSVTGVVLDDGQELPADDVVAGIGASPRTDWLDPELLAADGGVRVDTGMRTDDRRIFAAGDIATIRNPLYGVPLRSEHWTNALRGGGIAARSMLGQDSRFDPVPFVFTDQYELFVEHVGRLAPDQTADPIIRGTFKSRSFQAFWLHDRRVVAAMHVNRPDEGVKPLQALIRAAAPVDPDRLADPSVPLASLLSSPSVLDVASRPL